jgi:hypothetical protein
MGVQAAISYSTPLSFPWTGFCVPVLAGREGTPMSKVTRGIFYLGKAPESMRWRSAAMGAKQGK